MRIQVINPNTSAAMTRAIAEAASAVASTGTTVAAAQPDAGPPSVEGHYDEAMAAPGVLTRIREGEEAGVDGHVIACFGDPGLLAARELAQRPVVGIAEAAMHMASLVSSRFAVITTLTRTRGMAARLVEEYGMTRRCCAIRATDIPVLELEEPDPETHRGIASECRRALADDGAQAIVLGCAGMADLPSRLSRELGVPVIDGVSAAVKLVESLVSLGLTTGKTGELAYPIAKTYSGEMQKHSP